jgi:hypothetical protein
MAEENDFHSEVGRQIAEQESRHGDGHGSRGNSGRAVSANRRANSASASRRGRSRKHEKSDELDDVVSGTALLGIPDGTASVTQIPEKYRVVGGCLCRVVGSTPSESTLVPLCNFSAEIVEQTVFDDGVEQIRRLGIQGTLQGGKPLPRIDITTTEFLRGDYPLACWGSEAVVHAGLGTRDHLRAAIQIMSITTVSSTIFGHLGWRENNGEYIYLHADGAIGPKGPVHNISVDLPEVLQYFVLATPPSGADLIAAVSASLSLADGLAPDSVILPLLATIYRAVLPEALFSAFLVGRTGTGKTELAALAQQHWGPAMIARRLPDSWSSTSNSNEALAFLAKDALLVVDDFCPTGAQADVARANKDADRLFRAQGNRSGRQRMRADATIKLAKPPRGLILGTGEDLPKGHSLRARIAAIPVKPQDVNFARLSECQAMAKEGRYAQAIAAYIVWLAARYEQFVERFKADSVAMRNDISAVGQHRRTPVIMAELFTAFKLFVEFASEIGAVTPDEAVDLCVRCRSALLAMVTEQTQHQSDADPCVRYFALLGSALTSGRAHLANRNGDRPENAPEAWGWRRRVATGENQRERVWDPTGKCIGWIEGEEIYLDSNAAYATANGLAAEQGDSLGVTPYTLHKRLAEQRLLASADQARGHLTIRRVLAGTRRSVLHVHASKMSLDTETVPIGPTSENDAENGTVSRDGSSDHEGNRPTTSSHLPLEDSADGTVGPNGTVCKLKNVEPAGRRTRTKIK